MTDLDAGRAQRPRDIESAGILVRLHTNQADQTEIAARSEQRQQCRDVDAAVGFIDHVDVNGDVRTEHLTLRAIRRYAVEGCKGIGRYQRPPPPYDVPVVIVVGRFDQNELEAPLWVHALAYHVPPLKSSSKEPGTGRRRRGK